MVWCAEGSGPRGTSCLTNFLYYLIDDYTIKDIERNLKKWRYEIWLCNED